MRLDLHLDEVFAAGVDDVWRALTEPAVLARWLMDNDFDARAGRRFTLTGPPTTDWGGRIECTVVEIDPPRRMAWSWNGGTPDEVDTRVVFEVRPETCDGHTTRLQLRHTGDAMPAQRHALRAMWSRRLDCLGGVLAPGYACRLRIDAPRARVFDAVATAEGIAGWWTPISRADGDRGMRLRLTAHDELVGVRVDAVRRPSWVRWSCTTHVGERVWDGNVVMFELVDLGTAGCEIRVRHEGVPGRAVERGWDRVLGLLAASPGP